MDSSWVSTIPKPWQQLDNLHIFMQFVILPPLQSGDLQNLPPGWLFTLHRMPYENHKFTILLFKNKTKWKSTWKINVFRVLVGSKVIRLIGLYAMWAKAEIYIRYEIACALWKEYYHLECNPKSSLGQYISLVLAQCYSKCAVRQSAPARRARAGVMPTQGCCWERQESPTLA